MHKVFIDGGHGTTGLRIHEYLCRRDDIELLQATPELRKDTEARLELIRQADVSILCLPDAAAREIAQLAPEDAVLIDTSTAHRTDPAWVYGMPELAKDQRDRIRASTRIANPGCHASGFILLVRPLVDAGLLPPEALLTCFCVTGYSGGGKKMIAQYESPGMPEALHSPGQYALGQQHKHLPEMIRETGLLNAPCFCPVVSDFYSGMVMTVPVHAGQLAKPAGLAGLREILEERYAGEPLVKVTAGDPEGGFLYAGPMAGRNDVEIRVSGNDERILLTAAYDNLGKGASGAAVQNLNIVLGAEETLGLVQD
ncbi:MAG: N-acetyl-gamma-glutamyl-phosphate reductase [Mogibacterium sp.]|nr:N-acetyl-gamma-glutamyl-phosphate reductase [Mogibacterium sp.]